MARTRRSRRKDRKKAAIKNPKAKTRQVKRVAPKATRSAPRRRKYLAHVRVKEPDLGHLQRDLTLTVEALQKRALREPQEGPTIHSLVVALSSSVSAIEDFLNAYAHGAVGLDWEAS